MGRDTTGWWYRAAREARFTHDSFHRRVDPDRGHARTGAGIGFACRGFSSAMSGLLLAARLLLAAVFALSGAAKLLDRAGARRAVNEFGIPARLARPVATVLPLVELAAAAALLAPVSTRQGALAALALFALFSVAIARALRQGRRPDCHCFGQLHSAPAGPGTLVRNLLLAGVTGFILAAGWSNPGASVAGWLVGNSPATLAAISAGAALIALQAWFSWQLLRQQARLLLRIELLEADRPALLGPGLAPSRIAPDFSLPRNNGGRASLARLRATGQPLLLIFSDSGCGPCRALLSEIAIWHLKHAQALRLVVLSRPGSAASSEAIEQPRSLEVLVDEDGKVRELYGVHAVPAAVVVGLDGRVAAPAALGAEAIRALVDAAVQAPASSEAPEELSDEKLIPAGLGALLAGAGSLGDDLGAPTQGALR
jgi:uncharacterized membrane protein YphA (DoxX/SURF4 family)/peroxiredoxin